MNFSESVFQGLPDHTQVLALEQVSGSLPSLQPELGSKYYPVHVSARYLDPLVYCCNMLLPQKHFSPCMDAKLLLLCKVTKNGPLNQPCCSDTFKAPAFIELLHHPPVKVICCSLSTPPTHQGEKKKRRQDPYLQEHFSVAEHYRFSYLFGPNLVEQANAAAKRLGSIVFILAVLYSGVLLVRNKEIKDIEENQQSFLDLLKEYAQTSLKATLQVWGFWCGWIFMSYIGTSEVENAKFSNKN